MEIWVDARISGYSLQEGVDRVIGTDLTIENGKLYDEGRLIGSYITIENENDQQKAMGMAGIVEWLLVDFDNWAMIPIENLISAFNNTGTKLAAIIRSIPEAQGAGFALELGVDALVTKPVKELIDACKIVKSIRKETHQETTIHAQEESDRIELSKSVIETTEPIGTGDRACVDLTVLLRNGEGMLVGSSSQSMCLIHGETIESEYVPTRPFRVNAGSVNMYVMMADMSTKYISELTSGDKVLLVDLDGETRTASIGRVKIEHRPLILLKWSDRNGNNYHACIQQAETVRLVSSAGKTVSITDLSSGTEIITYESQTTRHIGKSVSSSVREI